MLRYTFLYLPRLLGLVALLLAAAAEAAEPLMDGSKGRGAPRVLPLAEVATGVNFYRVVGVVGVVALVLVALGLIRSELAARRREDRTRYWQRGVPVGRLALLIAGTVFILIQ